ncbi:hypothetical protein WN944_003343 [Citrus x changshan-huyou]|uniref:PORR domain-containing protein n=1 Tax=Citrus x changshan-huyou TaxID=2935761 RepID=A0AAP0M1G0_9ROSI
MELKEAEFDQEAATTIYCNNMLAIAMTNDVVFHVKSTHIELRDHYICDLDGFHLVPSGGDLVEKRALAVLHELLWLLVLEKKRENLFCLGDYLGFCDRFPEAYDLGKECGSNRLAQKMKNMATKEVKPNLKQYSARVVVGAAIAVAILEQR